MQYPPDNMNTMFQPKVYMEYPHEDIAYIWIKEILFIMLKI
jgi:hypothetical protein